MPPHQDEAGVVPVPPAEGRHADLRVLAIVENLTAAVGVSAQDEAGLKPLQQLRRHKPPHQPPRQRPLAAHLHHHSFITTHHHHHLRLHLQED